MVLLVLNNQTGDLLSGPDIISRGFISEEEYPDLIQEAKNGLSWRSWTNGEIARPEQNWSEMQERSAEALKRLLC